MGERAGGSRARVGAPLAEVWTGPGSGRQGPDSGWEPALDTGPGERKRGSLQSPGEVDRSAPGCGERSRSTSQAQDGGRVGNEESTGAGLRSRGPLRAGGGGARGASGHGWRGRGATPGAGGGAPRPRVSAGRSVAHGAGRPSWKQPLAGLEPGPAAGEGDVSAGRSAGGLRGRRDGAAHLGFVQPLSEPVHHRRAGPARPAALPPRRGARARRRRSQGAGGRRAGAQPGDAPPAARGANPQTAAGDRLTRLGAPAPRRSLTPAPPPAPAARTAHAPRPVSPLPAARGPGRPIRKPRRAPPEARSGLAGPGNYKARRASQGRGPVLCRAAGARHSGGCSRLATAPERDAGC